MAKAVEAFRTISEVADDLGIQKHVLRFWEVKFSQIRPMKRGGGRRYYRPEDMELLRGIRHLLHRDGYTIKGVQKILREQGVEAVKLAARGDTEPAGTVGQPVGTAEVAASGRKKAAKRATPADKEQALASVIAELKQLRELLKGRGADAAAPAPPKTARRRQAN